MYSSEGTGKEASEAALGLLHSQKAERSGFCECRGPKVWTSDASRDRQLVVLRVVDSDGGRVK